ncbi:nucleotide-diphospho-sugar transferase-domain-containing protein [Baffinella frigidus]|nr:nucleotide-diphospho-sugar transferase-domain-containing protein [Cryptophyta sp. CCMP2293]
MGSRGCLSRGSLVRAAALILMSLLSSESSPSSPSDRSASVAFPDSPLAIAAAARSALCSSPPCGRRVIVGFSNMGYRKFTLNWVLSMRLAGVENFLVVALEERAHAFFVKHKVPSFFHPSLFEGGGGGGEEGRGVDQGPLHHSSGAFRDVMQVRLRAVLLLLRQGFDVFLTDVDAVFNSDPFAHVSASHGADLAYDTPFLPKGPGSPLMVMAGFFHLRACEGFPGNCELLEETLAHQEAHPAKHDQVSFNAVVADKVAQGRFSYSLLDPLRFVNGALFFSDRAPQMLGVKAVVVQNNHMTGAANKEHRFREHLLWFLDPPSYFQDQTERFILYDNIQAAGAGIVAEGEALRNGLALARQLNRTVLLPLFCLYKAEPGVYQGSSDWCTTEEYFQMANADKAPVKEHSFLLNPLTPPGLMALSEAAPKLFLNPFQSSHGPEAASDGPEAGRSRPGGRGRKGASSPAPEVTFVPADPAAGASPAEIQHWFGEESEYGAERFLSFASLHGTRLQEGGGAGAWERELARGATGAAYREEIARHINSTVEAMVEPFSCVVDLARQKQEDLSEDSTGMLLERMLAFADSSGGQYMAIEGLTPLHLEAVQMLFPNAYAFQLYPWLSQGMRREQLALGVHRGVCAHASEILLAMPASAAARAVCAAWEEQAPPGHRACTPLP